MAQGYDPQVNPRNLQAVSSPEHQEALGQREAELQAQLDAYHRQVAMFGSAGWKSTSLYLQEQLNEAYTALADPEVIDNIEKLTFMQGQIRAFEFLLGLPHLIVQNQKLVQQELRHVQQARSQQ